jgi:uncharacterized protein YjcR
MTGPFKEILEILRDVQGLIIASAWALWEWRKRKGQAARDRVETIDFLVESVETLSRKYDELLNGNNALKAEIAALKNQLREKDELVLKLQSRIVELEKHQQHEK